MDSVLWTGRNGIGWHEVTIPASEYSRRWWRNEAELGSRTALSALWSDHGGERLDAAYQVEQLRSRLGY